MIEGRRIRILDDGVHRLCGILILSLTGAWAGGCINRTAFVCETDGECEVGGRAGFCEATGYCSVADPSCPSGHRYATDAPGGLAKMCVGESGDPDGAPPGDGAADAGTDAPSDASTDATTTADGAVDADTTPDAAILADFTPSNFPAARLTAGAGVLKIKAADGLVLLNSDTGSVTRQLDGVDLRPAGAAFLVVSQGAGAPPLGLLSVGSVEIDSGADLRVVGGGAMALAVAGAVTIGGHLDGRGGFGVPETPGPGGYAGGKSGGPAGGGGCGGLSVEALGDIGGGGAGHGAVGGAGGARSSTAGGAGGGVCGSAALSPLVGGSGGGAGGGGLTRGHGGGGGGALQISARGAIDVLPSGVINAGGGGGGGGGNDDGGGGGGAGGAVLLEGLRINIAGAVVVNGGGGGAGANMAVMGASGQQGGPSSNRPAGGPGAGEGGAGGQGGAGTTPVGDAGQSVNGVSGSDNAGGGGGGGGRVRLRAQTIAKPGTISPIAALSEAPL